MEKVVDVVDAIGWMVQVRPTATGEVAEHDEVMYCQKVLLVHSPCLLMLIWSRPCL